MSLSTWRGIALVMLMAAAAVVVPVGHADRASAQEIDDAVAQVVGGREAGDHEFPYLATIFFDGYQRCGGALIASDWVVSAAHCFADEPINSIIVGLGSADLHDGLQLRAVARVVIHPSFDSDQLTDGTNDIALVQLAAPVDLTDPTIGLIAIPDEIPSPGAPGILIVLGWGDTDPSDNFEAAVVARAAEVLAISCGLYGGDGHRICTADQDGGGGCTGDSGGPLVEVSGRVHTVTAIVEATSATADGTPLCGSGFTVIHQRVAPHVGWIRSTTGEPFRTCSGLPVTVEVVPGVPFVGTDADDVVFGTEGSDEIDGGGGDDAICSGAGDDQIHGGAGNDYIDGASGRDRIFGDSGNDVLVGGPDIDRIRGGDGSDTVSGDGGSDRIWGDDGNDTVHAGSGADRVWGGPGDDILNGMGGQDQMWGEAGNDVMQGNFQSDNLFGGPGDDTMFGAGGKDTLFGEGGNDTLVGGDNTDYLNGGADVDSANGGRGRDKPLTEPKVSPGNGRFRDGAGCMAETIVNCQTTP